MIIISTLHKQVCFRVRARVFVFFFLSVGLYVLCFVYVSHRFDKYSVLFLFTNNTHSHFFSLTLMLRSFYCLLFTHTHSLSLGRDKICFTFYSVVVQQYQFQLCLHHTIDTPTRQQQLQQQYQQQYFFLCSSYSSYDIHMGFWLVLFLFCLMEDIFVYLAFRVNVAQKSELFMLVQVVCVIRSITFPWFLVIHLCVFWDFAFLCCYFTISYLIVLYRFSIVLRFFFVLALILMTESSSETVITKFFFWFIILPF